MMCMLQRLICQGACLSARFKHVISVCFVFASLAGEGKRGGGVSFNKVYWGGLLGSVDCMHVHVSGFLSFSFSILH